MAHERPLSFMMKHVEHMLLVKNFKTFKEIWVKIKFIAFVQKNLQPF